MNVVYRIITGIILLPVVLFAFFMGGIYLNLLLLLVGLIASLEIAIMILPKNKMAIILSVVIWLGILFPIMFLLNTIYFLPVLALLFFILNTYFLFDLNKDHVLYEKLSIIFYFSCYVFIGIASVFWLQNEIAFILCACIVTWLNDICAYFFGRIFGKRPLFLSISPKKTWEGFIFGSMGALIGALLIHKISFFQKLTLSDILWIAIPSLILAPMGDLVESKLKRLYDIKDSSKILPGHGGILDRIDGLLLVLPWTMVYVFLIKNIS